MSDDKTPTLRELGHPFVNQALTRFARCFDELLASTEKDKRGREFLKSEAIDLCAMGTIGPWPNDEHVDEESNWFTEMLCQDLFDAVLEWQEQGKNESGDQWTYARIAISDAQKESEGVLEPPPSFYHKICANWLINDERTRGLVDSFLLTMEWHGHEEE